MKKKKSNEPIHHFKMEGKKIKHWSNKEVKRGKLGFNADTVRNFMKHICSKEQYAQSGDPARYSKYTYLPLVKIDLTNSQTNMTADCKSDTHKISAL